MRGWRDRRGAGSKYDGLPALYGRRMFALTRGVRGPRREPRRGLLGCGFTSVGFGGLGGLGRLGLGAWGGLGAWALGRLGRLGAWETWALGRLGDLGRTSLRGRGFPALGFTGAGFTGVASGRASRGLPAGFRRASGGLPAGFRRASGGLPAGFRGASRGFHWGLSRRAFPAGFPGGLSRGFSGASGGLSRRVFPAGFSGGRASGVGGQFFSELLALCGCDKTPPRFFGRGGGSGFLRLSRRWLRRRAASRRARWP